MNDIDIERRAQDAVELFMRGRNCSQSVVAAFADIYGIDRETALKMSAGFGGGVGRMRMMCGAVSGMVILAGLEKGNTEENDSTAQAGCYQLVQEFCEEFRKINGSIICAELLGLKGPVPTGDFVPSPRNAEYYRMRPCAAKVECAARIFAQYLSARKK